MIVLRVLLQGMIIPAGFLNQLDILPTMWQFQAKSFDFALEAIFKILTVNPKPPASGT